MVGDHLNLAKILKLKYCAEGVETIEQLDSSSTTIAIYSRILLFKAAAEAQLTAYFTAAND